MIARLRRITLAPMMLMIGLASPPGFAADGKELYVRCAACHQSSRAGVKGAFPPLGDNVKRLAQLDEGRRYLALVVLRGITGRIVVEGVEYRGAMPGQQGMSAEQVAAVLNYLITPADSHLVRVRSFTEQEVEKYVASPTAGDLGALARLRAEIES